MEYNAFDRRVFSSRAKRGEKFGWEPIECPCFRFGAVSRRSARDKGRKGDDVMRLRVGHGCEEMGGGGEQRRKTY